MFPVQYSEHSMLDFPRLRTCHNGQKDKRLLEEINGILISGGEKNAFNLNTPTVWFLPAGIKLLVDSGLPAAAVS